MNTTDEPRGTYVMPIHRVKSSFIIGIDPDKEKSGVAILNRQSSKFTLLTKLSFPALIELINNYEHGEALFVIEAGWKNKSTWHTPKDVHTWNGKQAWLHGAKIGKDVGRNHDVGEQLVNCLKEWGHEYLEYRPTDDKWNAEMFERQTGHVGRTNEEIRDAGKIAWINR